MAFDDESQSTDTFSVAIIGLSGRFPGAQSIEQFWSNLRDGIESITFASDEELRQELKNSAILRDPTTVKASSRLNDIDLFDAPFFGYSPKEAEMMDPQHRLFLQCAWEALEHSGYDPAAYPGLIGLYGGVGTNMYIKDLFLAQEQEGHLDGLQLTVGNEKDYLTTRVSYKLNLRGPSIGIQTACSTSLVAIHLACQALLDYDCDMALAGGVSVRAPQPKYYRYIEGSILSPDGHCRAFDAQGQGTLFGNGLGLVVLKRLADAQQDGDTIYAVIKGSAINNDGSDKIGYTAPGMQGQIKAIQHALDAAQIDPATISYIEAHGTGTTLGDPIEFSALQHIFRSVRKQQSCALGSVKTNIGHLDVAAGIAGLLKTVLALQHKQLPPTLHFQRPNPQIDLEHSPFYINQTLKEWSANSLHPRRAGVSSFGIGGTNAHVVLEEAPATIYHDSAQSHHLLILSARTPEALEITTTNMLNHLQNHPEQPLADIAYTSQVGRRAFTHRRALVCSNRDAAITTLKAPDSPTMVTGNSHLKKPFICFLFPGQGTQYIHMAANLYQTEPVFRDSVERCATLFKRHSHIQIKDLLYPPIDRQADAQDQLYQTRFTQPALFIIEYALAQLLLSWGLQPSGLIGHSIGEYVAACLAGVFSLEDAIQLVTARGELMQQCQSGSMLSIALSAQQVRPYLHERLSLASINAPTLTVVAGPDDAIEALQSQLIRSNIRSHKLHTSHAFHSWMMDEMSETFAQKVRSVKLHAPRIPYLSNVTGHWIEAEQATDPNYWVQHIRSTVQFQAGLEELLNKPDIVFIEVGPGQTLNKIVRQQATATRELLVVPTLQESPVQQSDRAFLLHSIARLWLAGLSIDWKQLHNNERRQRVALPTYPFARESHWLKLPARSTATAHPINETALSIPLWQQAIAPPMGKTSQTEERQHILLFRERDIFQHTNFITQLDATRYTVTQVIPGTTFAQVDEHSYTIDPANPDDYHHLLQEIQPYVPCIHTVVHLWNAQQDPPWSIRTHGDKARLPFYSVLYLLQALNRTQRGQELHLMLVSSNLFSVTGEENLQPHKALLLGPAKTVSLEHPEVRCQLIDVAMPHTPEQEQELIKHLLSELESEKSEALIAYRGKKRWRQTFQPLSHQQLSSPELFPGFRQGGTYLLTGGLGGIALGLAEQLAQDYQAQLILLTRHPFLEEQEWDSWLAGHTDDDRTSQRIHQLQRIKEHGGQTVLLVADVNKPEQVMQAIQDAEQKCGTLHGVLHLAGIPGSGLIQLKNKTIADAVLAPKVDGTLNLIHALEHTKLDFLILFSSLTAITGGIGQVDYSAANAFLSAVAQQHQQTTGSRTIAIDWDAWQWDSWQSEELHIMPELQRQLQQIRSEKGITFPQGLVFIQNILRTPCAQVIVSTQDIPTAIANHHHFANTFWTQQRTQTSTGRKATTITQVNYAAPRNEIETTLALLWTEALGIEHIGVHDHFIELGGHSLMAVQLLWKIRETFQINLAMNVLFEQDTIAGLADIIRQQLHPEPDPEHLERLIKEIEGLTEEEVEQLLLEEEQGSY